MKLGPTVRLVGGAGNNQGRVEVYHDGIWGTVCGDSWDINDATVVCRSLGFDITKQAKTKADFGQGSGPIWLNGVGCTGIESNLESCVHSGWGVENCPHSKDAGVVCSGEIGKQH